MRLKKGQRANQKRMEQLGFQRLSSSQWVKDGVKVQIVGRRIHNIQNQTKYKLVYRGGITYDDRRIGLPKPKSEIKPKKTKAQKRKLKRIRQFFKKFGLEKRS